MIEQPSKQARLDLPGSLKIFLSVTVLLAAATWLFAFIGWMLHPHSIYSWPYGTGDRGGDFSNYQQLFNHIHTMAFFQASGMPFMYPAPLAIYYHLLFAAWGGRTHCILILWAFIVLSVCAASIIFYVAMRRRSISSRQAALFCILTIVLSYPLHYEFQRGNVEVLLWVVLILAMWAYRNEKLWLAGIFLGIAIACKWYPVLLLGICLRKTKYKVIIVALVACALVTVMSDVWLGPTYRIAATETKRGTQLFLDTYAKGDVVLGQDHSFFALFKALAQHFRPHLGRALKFYFFFAGAGAALLYFARIRKLPIINQIVLLFVLSITLPPVSFDYTLLHLYTCWAIFTLYVLDRHVCGKRVPMANWAMFWFAFAMAPHGYAIAFGERYGAQVRLLGLVALIYLFLTHPFPKLEDRLVTDL